jgi:hypothetical protein
MPNAKTRAAADIRRRNRGVSPATLARAAKSAVPPTIRRRKKEATLVKYKAVKALFDEYIEVIHQGSYKLEGKSVGSWAEWIQAGLPFPDINIIEAFLEFFIDGSSPTVGSAIQRSSLDRVAKVLMASWRYDTHELIKGPRRKAVYVLLKHLYHKKNLGDSPRRRAKLDRHSISALMQGAMDPTFSCFPRQRLSIMLYLALTSQTATRPMASLRHRRPRGPAGGGAKYHQFRLFAMRDENSTVNKIGGFFKTQDDKNDFGKHRIYPLPSGPQIKLSTPHLLLFACYVDGFWTQLDLEHLLDPNYLDGEDAKAIVWPEAW